MNTKNNKYYRSIIYPVACIIAGTILTIIVCLLFFDSYAYQSRLMIFLLILLLTASFFVFFKLTMPLLRINRILTGIKAKTLNNATQNIKSTVIEKMFCELLIETEVSSQDIYKLEVLRKQAEISALQSQINPHFLYNTLEAIRGQAVHENSETIAEMVKALATLFRYSISEKGHMVTLKEDLLNVESYMTIQKFRFRDKYSILYDIEDQTALDIMIPKLTIQPIVENAICHGLECKVGKGAIAIRLRRRGKNIALSIIDDGVGIEDKQLYSINEMLKERYLLAGNLESNKSNGVALQNVNERIRIMCGEEYGISVYSTAGKGTEVEILLPSTDPNLDIT